MIKNVPTICGNEKVDAVRAAIEHRGTWMYLLLEEAEKKGLGEDYARAAITRAGLCSKERKPHTNSLREYSEAVFNNDNEFNFEHVAEITEDEVNVTVHYCPLVAAWQKLTDDEEKIAKLCDIAMDGDRAVFSNPAFKYEVTDKIADGCATCKMHITKAKEV